MCILSAPDEERSVDPAGEKIFRCVARDWTVVPGSKHGEGDHNDGDHDGDGGGGHDDKKAAAADQCHDYDEADSDDACSNEDLWSNFVTDT